MDEKEYKFWKEWINQKGNVRARLALMIKNKDEGNMILLFFMMTLFFGVIGAIMIASELFMGLIFEVIAFIILVLFSIEISQGKALCELYEIKQMIRGEP